MSALSDFVELQSLPQDAKAKDKRARGRKFEKALRALLGEESLKPETSYKPEGEEIDGAFELDGTIYLLEAKWHGSPLPASQVYNFKAKVDGKLVGTIGAFLSMSGYSEEAVDALGRGKSLNVILFDESDIVSAFGPSSSFKEMGLHLSVWVA